MDRHFIPFLGSLFGNITSASQGYVTFLTSLFKPEITIEKPITFRTFFFGDHSFAGSILFVFCGFLMINAVCKLVGHTLVGVYILKTAPRRTILLRLLEIKKPEERMHKFLDMCVQEGLTDYYRRMHLHDYPEFRKNDEVYDHYWRMEGLREKLPELVVARMKLEDNQHDRIFIREDQEFTTFCGWCQRVHISKYWNPDPCLLQALKGV